jgi:hypothetical protein
MGAMTGDADNNPATDKKKHRVRHLAKIRNFLFDGLFTACVICISFRGGGIFEVAALGDSSSLLTFMQYPKGSATGKNLSFLYYTMLD